MKLCEYCGRDNQDEAAFCRECGTGKFIRETDNATAKPSSDDPIELQRCRDSESLAQITQTLEAAGITYKQSPLPPMFGLNKIGADDDLEVIVSVPRNMHASARAALENAYLNMELPENHYLRTCTDEELVEIVAESSDWSAFDVAHAKRLIGERGIDLVKIEDKKTERLNRLLRGRPASKRLIFFGWLFSILGGLIGVGIAWSLCYMKEKTPEGEFFAYDEKSRAAGRKMLTVGVTVLVIGAIFKLLSLRPN